MKHLDGKSETLSCFLSLTSDKGHARDLAMKRAGYIQDPYQYSDDFDDLVRCEIDTEYLHAHVYKVVDLVLSVGEISGRKRRPGPATFSAAYFSYRQLVYVFHIPVPSHRHISDEYLILKQTPEEAIVDMSTIKDMTSEFG
ncbi:hypothetical protein EG327_011042 [Venturia inaequalis]|uniref:Uncharacterized protein n=1 Tax=Venturia inaequalis TaxID=5025 RepID=A0A8H3ZA18_VENIN|nr:hypothetical protein EG327_011042 [Venturia inaequalis]